MRYIDTKEDLLQFVEEASESSILALDTEFIREKTYYPILCLIQAATDSEIAIIDCIAIDDVTPLATLLQDESILKIFHAATQDIELLIHFTRSAPHPVFDTQIAASLLGQSHQAGLGSLVHSFCGVTLDKKDSFTDWQRRPLTDSQIEYAAEDVIYLPELYGIMSKMLEEQGRLDWLDDSFRELSDPERYMVDPYERYKKLKRVNQLTERQMAAAREVAAWRELKAQKRNLPRKWVMTDEQIVEACRRETKSIDELFLIRGLKGHLSTKDAREIVDAMNRAFSLPDENLPKHEKQGACEPNVDFSIDLMQALVRLRSRETGIATQTLASHSELQQLARGHVKGNGLMSGWRKKIVGDELMRLLKGDIVLSLDDNELVVNERAN